MLSRTSPLPASIFYPLSFQALLSKREVIVLFARIFVAFSTQSLFSYLFDAIRHSRMLSSPHMASYSNLISRFLRGLKDISRRNRQLRGRTKCGAAIKSIFIRDLPAICASRNNGDFKGSRVNILRLLKNDAASCYIISEGTEVALGSRISGIA